jgi:hypothetical protein
MDFLIEVIKNDNNLSVLRYAGFIFTDETKLQIKAVAAEYFENWWKNNRSKYLPK